MRQCEWTKLYIRKEYDGKEWEKTMWNNREEEEKKPAKVNHIQCD